MVHKMLGHIFPQRGLSRPNICQFFVKWLGYRGEHIQFWRGPEFSE